MITAGHTVLGCSPWPGIERECNTGADAHTNRIAVGIGGVEHDRPVADIDMQVGVDCAGSSFKGEVLGVEPFSSALFSANSHGILGEAATQMQETQMSFNLRLRHEPGACYKTPAAEAWGNAVGHRTPEAAIVYNGHAGLGA